MEYQSLIQFPKYKARISRFKENGKESRHRTYETSLDTLDGYVDSKEMGRKRRHEKKEEFYQHRTAEILK